MNIIYTEEKKFTQEQVQALFRSVGWVSGEQLIGLVRVLDDSEMVAYMHYVLVQPEYHGHGIAGTMIEMRKEKK